MTNHHKYIGGINHSQSWVVYWIYQWLISVIKPIYDHDLLKEMLCITIFLMIPMIFYILFFPRYWNDDDPIWKTRCNRPWRRQARMKNWPSSRKCHGVHWRSLRCFSIGKPSENCDLSRKNGDLIWLVVWNHGILWLSIQLGMSSSQLTFTPSFFRGVGQPPTRYDFILFL